MIIFLMLMAIPMVLAVIALLYFKGKVTWWEFAIQLAAPALLIVIFIGVSRYAKTYDHEIWNSQVISRDREQVSCSHSYSCHCHTDSKGHESCDTCYEHPYDIDWIVRTSSGEHLGISRVDSQGLIMPPRYRQAYIGEPFSSVHSYSNYMLANKDSVLNGGKGDIEKFSGLLPSYPKIYNVYRAHHFIVTGDLKMDTATWDWLLDEANKSLGPKKQVNLLLIVAKTDDPSYVLALKDLWVGGKKNDVIVVIGSLDGHKIEWADVMSWTPRGDLRVELRDQIQAIGTLDQRDAIVQAITQNVQDRFERMHMKEYHYLMNSVEMSTGQIIGCFILAVLLELGITWWVVANDETNDSY